MYCRIQKKSSDVSVEIFAPVKSRHSIPTCTWPLKKVRTVKTMICPYS